MVDWYSSTQGNISFCLNQDLQDK